MSAHDSLPVISCQSLFGPGPRLRSVFAWETNFRFVASSGLTCVDKPHIHFQYPWRSGRGRQIYRSRPPLTTRPAPIHAEPGLSPPIYICMSLFYRGDGRGNNRPYPENTFAQLLNHAEPPPENKSRRRTRWSPFAALFGHRNQKRPCMKRRRYSGLPARAPHVRPS